jgi:hypothetical protein
METGSLTEKRSSEQPLVEAFLDGYFSSWSRGDLEAYGQCFHADAVIFYADAAMTPHQSTVGPFLESQREAHAQSQQKMREIPLSKRIEIAGGIGVATVPWKLFVGAEETTGVDIFTLIKTAEGWKILALVFAADA